MVPTEEFVKLTLSFKQYVFLVVVNPAIIAGTNTEFVTDFELTQPRLSVT